MPNELELGSIMDEVKKNEFEKTTVDFLEEYLEKEKDFGYSFKDPIRDLLTKHVSKGGQ